MPTFEESWTSIAPLWAAVNDSDASQQTLTPSQDYSDATRVFGIQTSAVDPSPTLPEGADLVEAPLGPYDVVELTLFGRPAAKARIAFGDGLAVVGRFEFEPGTSPGDLGPGLLSALAEEAFLEGAGTMYTIAEGAEVPPFLGTGWAEFGRLKRA